MRIFNLAIIVVALMILTILVIWLSDTWMAFEKSLANTFWDSLPNTNALMGLFRSLAERLAFLGHINKGESNPDLLFGDKSTLIVSPSLCWLFASAQLLVPPADRSEIVPAACDQDPGQQWSLPATGRKKQLEHILAYSKDDVPSSFRAFSLRPLWSGVSCVIRFSGPDKPLQRSRVAQSWYHVFWHSRRGCCRVDSPRSLKRSDFQEVVSFFVIRKPAAHT
jgi:hypothetical protein